jgi:hypothetical protein
LTFAPASPAESGSTFCAGSLSESVLDQSDVFFKNGLKHVLVLYSMCVQDAAAIEGYTRGR